MLARTATWIVTVAFAAAALCGPAARAQCPGGCPSGASCQITNGGFESGTFSGWTQFGDTSSTGVITSGPGGAPTHGGIYAGRFGPTGSTGGISQSVAANPGDVVLISFWYAATEATNSFSAVFDGQTIVSYTNDTAHTSWTQYTARLLVASINPTLTFTFYNPPSYDYLDDVGVCVIPGCGGTCAGSGSCGVANGGFETGGIQGWTLSGGASASNVLPGGHTGDFAFAYGSATSSGEIMQTMPASAGEMVNISFWYKAEGSNNFFEASFDGHTLVSLVNDTTHTSWTQFTYSVQSTSTNPTLSFAFSNSADHDYLDDVSACVTQDCGAACPAGSSCTATNGSFESGSFSGWSQFGDFSACLVYSGHTFGDFVPHGGTFAGAFGPAAQGGISQTVAARAGDSVNIQFWYADFNVDTSFFSAAFGGVTLVSYTNDAAHTTWTPYNFTVIATSDNPTLAFTFENDSGYDFLDEVSVCVTPSCTTACPAGSFCGASNDGFETGSFAGWAQSGDTSFTAVASGTFDNELAPHGGTYAAHFGPNVGVGIISQIIPASIGDYVSISFWYAAFGTNNSFAAISDGHPIVNLVNDTAHQTWTQYTYSYTASSNNPTLTFNITNPPDYTFLDDITVCIAPACQSACGPGSSCGLANGGFESGTFGPWAQSGETDRMGVYTGSQFGVGTHSGSAAAFFDAPLQNSISQAVAANAGDEVVITFWYQAFSTSNSFSASFGGNTLLTLTNDTAHHTWTQFVFPVVAPVSNPSLTFTVSNFPGVTYLDDVSACVTSHGVCCRGATCNASVGPDGCVTSGTHAGAVWSGATEMCNGSDSRTTPCCEADYNKVNGVTVQDIFDMLADWFTQSPFARIGGDGTGAAPGVQSIFDFLSAWFAGGC